MPIETWQLKSIHLLCIFIIFSDASRDIQAQMHAFLMPTLIHYSTSRSETNFDTDGAITLTVINLVAAILNLTSLCCLIYYLQIRLCQIYVGYQLSVSCRCHAYVSAGGWGGETQSHETLPQHL